jgi:hypothetical protein
MAFSRIVLLTVAAILITGCASKPEQQPIQNSRTYDTDFDITWARLMQFFTAHNV